MKITNDVLYANVGHGASRDAPTSLLLDIYEPSGSNAPRLRPGFVAVHGGGLGRADKRDANMVELCRELATAVETIVEPASSARLRLHLDQLPAAAP